MHEMRTDFVKAPRLTGGLLLRPVSQRAHAWANAHLAQFLPGGITTSAHTVWLQLPPGVSDTAVENIHAAGYTVAQL
jgi:hypothetical protein